MLWAFLLNEFLPLYPNERNQGLEPMYENGMGEVEGFVVELEFINRDYSNHYSFWYC